MAQWPRCGPLPSLEEDDDDDKTIKKKGLKEPGLCSRGIARKTQSACCQPGTKVVSSFRKYRELMLVSSKLIDRSIPAGPKPWCVVNLKLKFV